MIYSSTNKQTYSELIYSSTSQTPINIDHPTRPEFSRLTITSKVPLLMCDTLEVHIEARDGNDNPKAWGGDYFWVWLKSTDGLKTSGAADEIIDHHNGTYTARFQLHWSGEIQIIAGLVHSSEAVFILRRNRDMFPARYNFQGQFEYKNATMITPCHVTRDLYLPPTDVFIDRTICDFTDGTTGFPWFCVKPEGFPCDSYIAHSMDGNATEETRYNMMNENERELFAGLRYNR